jgi:SpoVK/Ycf46/Vps4 family AAA+-type ATPase
VSSHRSASHAQPDASFSLEGLPDDLPPAEAILLRTRVFEALREAVRDHRPRPFTLRVGYRQPPGAAPRNAGLATATSQGPATPRSWPATDPVYTLDQLKLPGATLDRILDSVALVEVQPRVFGEWNLRAIEPHPSTAINFRGPSGTGKTMAAHAIADRLKRKILLSRLSELESKYHGDGPKHVASLFQAARDQNAVLFLDEAESLLSRRFAQPDQAAESAINSMRTELLMSLDSFEGLVIFASNLPHSYDRAISSRLLHVDFELPDRALRERIWRSHLVPELPLADDVVVAELAEIDGVSGRDIKLAIIMAAVGAARRGRRDVTMGLLTSSLERQRTELESAGGTSVTPSERTELEETIRSELARRNGAGSETAGDD